MLLQMAMFYSAYGWVTFPYMLHLYSFVCWWTLRLLPYPVNNAAMKTEVHASFQISVFVFFVYLLKSAIAGSYGSFIFSFLRYCTIWQQKKKNLSKTVFCTVFGYILKNDIAIVFKIEIIYLWKPLSCMMKFLDSNLKNRISNLKLS